MLPLLELELRRGSGGGSGSGGGDGGEGGGDDEFLSHVDDNGVAFLGGGWDASLVADRG